MNNTQCPICESDRDELLSLKYTEVELNQLEQFAMPFCLTGRLYLVRIFVRGKLLKKTFPEIMSVCEALWEETWKNGNPERIGDPDDVGNPTLKQVPFGLHNTCAFFEAYKRLGFKFPFPKFLF